MKVCYSCKSTEHQLRDCPRHKSLKQVRKEVAGDWAEDLLSKCITCTNCGSRLIRVEGKLPSLDLVCTDKSCKYEVKSKCLSVPVIPDYIKINAGQYTNFKKRILFENLSLILLMYSVDEREDTRVLREVRVINNDILRRGIIKGLGKNVVSGLQGKELVVLKNKNTGLEECITSGEVSIVENNNKSFIVIPNLKMFSVPVQI